MLVIRLVCVCMVTVGIAVALGACNKLESDSAREGKAAASNQAGVAGKAEGPVDEHLFQPAEPTVENVAAQVRTLLPAVAPQHQFTIQPATDTLAYNGDSPVQLAISAFCEKVAAQVIATEEPVSDALVKSQISLTLELLAPKHDNAGQPLGGDQIQNGSDLQQEVLAEREKLEEMKNSPIDTAAKLIVPAKIIGSWKSIAEIMDSTVVEHDESYFDVLTFSDRTAGSYLFYRDGKMVSNDKFTYSFDPAKGRLLIHFEDGDVWTILLQQPESNQAELRFYRISEKTTTVFRLP